MGSRARKSSVPSGRPDPRQALGRSAEERAARHLGAIGWTIIARNWRCRRGELDLVAIERDWLVVVEVRARSSARFGTAAESVDARKRARLLDLGARFVYERRWQGPWRIDVIAVDPSADGTGSLTHLRNVAGP